MAASGVTRKRLPAGNDVLCTLSDPAVAELTVRLGTTRSATALELWRDRREGAVVAAGNAPAALCWSVPRGPGWYGGATARRSSGRRAGIRRREVSGAVAARGAASRPAAARER